MKLFSLLIIFLMTLGLSSFAQVEQFGKHKVKTGRGKEILDFEFVLNYQDTNCTEGSYQKTGIKAFENDEQTNYHAPKLTGVKSINDLLMKNLRYPEYARENNIQGKVVVFLYISKDGSIEKISVKRGVHVSIDKVAVRVLRLMKKESPALVNGEPVNICMSLPIVFRME